MPEQNPTEGGSYIRQPDGSLTLAQQTAPKARHVATDPAPAGQGAATGSADDTSNDTTGQE